MKLEAPATSAAAAAAAAAASVATTPTVSGAPSPFSSNAVLAGISRVNSVGGHSTASYTSSVMAQGQRPDDVDLGAGTSSGPTAGPPVGPFVGPSALGAERYDAAYLAQQQQQQQQQQETDDAPVMGTQGGPDLGWNNGQPPTSNTTSLTAQTRQLSVSTALPSIPEPAPARRTPSPPPPQPQPQPPSISDPPPPVPSVNPWQTGSRPAGLAVAEEAESDGSPADGTNEDTIVVPERRRRASTRPDSPTLPSPTSATTPVVAGSSTFFVPPPPPPTSTTTFAANSTRSHERRQDDGVDAWQQQLSADQRSLRSSMTIPPSGYLSRMSPTSPYTRHSAPTQTSAPRNAILQRQSQASTGTILTNTSTSGSVSNYDAYLSGPVNYTRDSSMDPISPVNAFVSPISPISGPEPQLQSQLQSQSQSQPPLTAASFASGAAPSPQPTTVAPEATVAQIPRTMLRVSPNEQAGLEIIPPAVDIDSGLIPVDSPVLEQAASREERIVPVRPADCNIGPNSSFHRLKGFCEGAKEVQRGKVGVRKIKKLVRIIITSTSFFFFHLLLKTPCTELSCQQSYSGAGTEAAKCKSCLFELKWTEVDKDWQNHRKEQLFFFSCPLSFYHALCAILFPLKADQPRPTASVNYRMHGIGFRLRFLSKCHLPAKQVDDPLYACIFCLQQGHTLEESDATVFFSQGQLFSHLSRHPRPLPHVPGVTVIEGAEVPPEFRNNYDVHFTQPPTTSDLDGIRRELQQLPTATAIETFRKTHGALRRPPDGAGTIQFPEGSKIVGIQFPQQYKGEWAVGWFDNVRGAFPVEHVQLDPPRRSEIRTQGTSTLQATMRWKWASSSAYRNSDWLRLDRNETVSNIVWAYPEHWCWAGTNAKGKWGYFPQSHIMPGSLVDGGGAAAAGAAAAAQVSDAASILSYGRGGPGTGVDRLMLRFRGHNNNNNSGASSIKRPVSISSHSTSSSR